PPPVWRGIISRMRYPPVWRGVLSPCEAHTPCCGEQRCALRGSLTAPAHAAIKGQCHPGGCLLARSLTGSPRMQCAHCHTENRSGRRFCAECGAPLALPCAACGFANEPGDKFCGGCGTPLSTAPHTPESRMPSPQAYTPSHLTDKILAARPALTGERKQVTV